MGAVTNMPSVNEATAIMLTIELGLDKMYRDYRSFFIGNCITVGSCLDAYKVMPSSPNLNDNLFCEHLKEQFILVQKLHHITEFVIQCKTLFSLSDEVIFTKAGRILRDYTALELDFNKKFDFDVDFTEVKKMIVDRPPTVWKLILCSNEGKHKRSTCCTWMSEYPFRGILSPPMNVNDSAEESHNSKVGDSLQYHVSIQTTSHLILNPLASLAAKEFKWNNKI